MRAARASTSARSPSSRAQARWQQGVGGQQQGGRCGLGVVDRERAGGPAAGQDAREDHRLLGEITRPAFHVGRAQRSEDLVDAVVIVPHAVEAEQHPSQQHPPDPLVPGQVRRVQLAEPLLQQLDDPIDGRRAPSPPCRGNAGRSSAARSPPRAMSSMVIF